MSVPDDRRYAETHEWFRLDGDLVIVGITQFAADELTDITYVDLPETGVKVEAGDLCGEIESVKATAELFCALAGEIVEINATLSDQPELINQDAHGQGWIYKLEPADPAAIDQLMTAKAYQEFVDQ
ncbi:MAG: glycine cleavage system protein GcvH [Planctomycetes bacterium]|nr:glycine cleavage system protein GcvH [Planctomycetota bacterium]